EGRVEDDEVKEASCGTPGSAGSPAAPVTMSAAIPVASPVALAEAPAAVDTSTPTARGAPVTRVTAVSSHPLPQPRSKTDSATGDASITASRSRVEPSSLLTPEKQAPWALTSSSPTPGWA